MRIVLDTNVLVSALISPAGGPRQLYDLWRANAFVLVSSNGQIQELSGVLRYDKLQRFITETVNCTHWDHVHDAFTDRA